jgi:alcohol dehydrogenase, propanol-preferring
MRAMVLHRAGERLREEEVPVPAAAPGQLLLRVRACAVCRTDLHVVDGELPEPKLPLIPGHEIVGEVVEIGEGVEGFAVGDRVGVPWLGWTCGECSYCLSQRENLCLRARFTGYTLDGGYAEHAVADARFCFPLPAAYADAEAAPLLCAGLIGYRSLRMAGDAERLGIYGFGAAAHIVAQVARHQGRRVFAFTRPGDLDAQRVRAGAGGGVGRRIRRGSAGAARRRHHLRARRAPWCRPPSARSAPGGTVVCGGIHMSEIPAFPYEILWGERTLRSVANLTRADARAFLSLAPRVPVRTEVRASCAAPRCWCRMGRGAARRSGSERTCSGACPLRGHRALFA